MSFFNIICICPFAEVKNSVEMKVRLLHSQPFTDRHICFLILWDWWPHKCCLAAKNHFPALCFAYILPGYAGKTSAIMIILDVFSSILKLSAQFSNVLYSSLFSPCSSLFSWLCILMVETYFSHEKNNVWTSLRSFQCYHCTSYPMKTIWLTKLLTVAESDACCPYCKYCLC